MRHLIAFVLVAGCSSPRLSKQDRAEAIVWRGTYGMVEPPPAVEWVCSGQLSPGVTGRTLLGTGIQVAAGPDCSDPIRTTQYAHELEHWKCYLETGDVDAAHSHCDWGEVQRALAAMAAAGME